MGDGGENHHEDHLPGFHSDFRALAQVECDSLEDPHPDFHVQTGEGHDIEADCDDQDVEADYDDQDVEADCDDQDVEADYYQDVEADHDDQDVEADYDDQDVE